MDTAPMHAFEYILIMLGAVLISSPISSRFPKVSTPLVQVALGIALTIIPISFEVTLDPELFLVLFIAPLLFEDAKKADKPALWRLKRPILLLALGLVFTTVLVVGFCVHWFTPSIPLAAAFALAAALAPTDAVAVASLKESATISEDQDYLLKGESLINDASGIVSFQFAVAAVLTGTFSIIAATTTFLFLFFGGIAVGVVLILLRSLLVSRLRAMGIDNITFHVLFEVITPFLIFLIAESLHVSGIIAVVAAGILYSFVPRQAAATPTSARHNIVSTSVWAVITFSLNGLVFLMLGTQLPYVIQRVWSSSAAADWPLILFIVFILLAVMILRFFWVLVMRVNTNLATAGAVAGGAVGSTGEDAEDVRAAADIEGTGTPAEAGTAEGACASQALQGVGFEPTRALGTSPLLTEGFGTMDAAEYDRVMTEQLGAGREAMRQQRKVLEGHRETKKADRRARRAEQRREAHADPGYWKHHLHDAVVLSLTGAKGAITLAVVLTIPLVLSNGDPFPERDLIIFLASGAILLSLLLANFVVPLVVPKKAEPLQPASEVNAILNIYRTVIRQLVDSTDPDHRVATELTVQQYYERISKFKASNTLANQEDAAVRRRIIEWEHEHTLELLNEGRVSVMVGLMYLDQLSRMLARIEHHNTVGWEFKGAIAQLAQRSKRARQFRKARKTEAGTELAPTRKDAAKIKIKASFELRELTIDNYLHVLVRLKDYAQEPDAPVNAIELISAEFERRVARLRNPAGPRGGSRTDFATQQLEVQARALEYEREAIADALSHDKISRTIAKQLRDNVAMMELDIEEQLE
jgi:CPA1 family monovalent cation:H+ antiporter